MSCLSLTKARITGYDQVSQTPSTGLRYLSLTTAIVGYAIGLENCQLTIFFFFFFFFCRCSNGSKFVKVTDNSNYIVTGVSDWDGVCFTTDYVAYASSNQNQNRLNQSMMNWCLMSSDVMRHIRDKLWPMPKHSAAINLYVHGNQKAR